MQQIDPPVYFVNRDLDSPGSVSVGQRSLGAESAVSAFSCASTKPFLKHTEKDECVHCRLEADGLADLENTRLCGIGRWRPKCIQKCASIQVFVACMSMLLIVSGALSTGYLNSVITTIEKRFQIGSTVSGIVIASYETGSLLSVIFVSYLGGRRHIPKWIGYGVVTMGFGTLLFALPHVIAPKYTIDNQKEHNFTDVNICQRTPTTKKGLFPGEVCIDENSGNWIYVLILVAAQVLLGVGGTPILTLGTTYIDNHVRKDQAPQYLAVVYATGALGPVIGYALGALMLQYYVDTFTHYVPITSSHPRWIGAWWGGFIICGLLILMLAIPFMAFPKVLVNEKRKLLEHKAKEDLLTVSENVEENVQYGKTIRDIPRSILRLLKNPIYIITTLGICCEIAIVSGFVVFLPKYIETQFGTSTSVANLFTGGIGIPGAVVGILLGGYISKRFQLRPKGAIQLTLALNLLALFGFTFFFFLGCENLKIAGATLPYFNSSGHKIFDPNLTSTCNENCDCSNTILEPICGINGITYFSPCHAGCTTSFGFLSPESQERMFNYSGCACIMGQNLNVGHEVIMAPLATSGPCKTSCENLLPFLIMLVVMTFCVAGAQMPLLMVTLRSVKQEERAFSLGMQFVILRLFAYVPTPIMFGNIIDTACLLWKQKCVRNGACLLYDRVAFRYKYVGMAAVLKAVGLIFFLTVWVILYKKNKQEAKSSVSIIIGEMNSLESIEKLEETNASSQVTYKQSPESPDSTERDENDVMVQRQIFITPTEVPS